MLVLAVNEVPLAIAVQPAGQRHVVGIVAGIQVNDGDVARGTAHRLARGSQAGGGIRQVPTKSVAFVVFAALLAFGGAVGRGTRREAVAGKPLLLPVPGLFQVRFGRDDGTRGAEAMLQCRMGEIPGVRAGGAETGILDIEQVPRVDFAAGGDAETGRRRHREQPVQFNRDAGARRMERPGCARRRRPRPI